MEPVNVMDFPPKCLMAFPPECLFCSLIPQCAFTGLLRVYVKLVFKKYIVYVILFSACYALCAENGNSSCCEEVDDLALFHFV